MTKLIIIVTVALGAVTFGASPVAAADCTKQYQECMNASWDTEGLVQKMADIECVAEYTGCVARKLIGW